MPPNLCLFIVIIVCVCFIFDIARSSNIFNGQNQNTMWMSARELNSVKTFQRSVTFQYRMSSFHRSSYGYLHLFYKKL